MTMKDDKKSNPQTFVHGVPEKDASLIAEGRGSITKKSQRGHVSCEESSTEVLLSLGFVRRSKTTEKGFQWRDSQGGCNHEALNEDCKAISTAYNRRATPI